MSLVAEGAVTLNRREERKLARTAELLEAALQAIRAHGAETSIEQVASQAGITRPVIYRHFGNASGLYSAVADWFSTELVARSSVATHGVRQGRALVAAQVDAYLSFLQDEPNLYRFLTENVPHRGAGDADPVAGFVQHLGARIAGFIGSGPASASSAAVAGRAFVGAIHTVSEWWLEDGALSREELSEELVRILWTGLRSVVAVSMAEDRS